MMPTIWSYTASVRRPRSLEESVMHRSIKPSQAAQLIAITVSLLLFLFPANADVGSNIDRLGGTILFVNYDTSQVNKPAAFFNALKGIDTPVQSFLIDETHSADSNILIPMMVTSDHFPLMESRVLHLQDFEDMEKSISLSSAPPVPDSSPVLVGPSRKVSPPRETVNRYEVPRRFPMAS